MEVSAIEREYQVTSREELESVLMSRVQNDENQFWLSHDGQEYPILGISVKGDIAYVYYVPRDRCAGFQSIGRIHGLPGDSTDFSIGMYDTISVQNEFVVPFSAALTAANEFFESAEVPSTIEWYEL